MRGSLYFLQLTLFIFTGVALVSPFSLAEKKKRTLQQDPLLGSPLLLGRAPASANPLLENKQILGVKKEPSKNRWRLLGTCRQDIGMNQNQGGLGYSDCKK